MIDPELQNAGIVLVGSFNPAIYSPHWFAQVGLIKAADAEVAETSVIHPELTVIKLNSIQLQVAPNRFSIGTTDVPLVKIADFAANLLGSVIPHTPINFLGINFEEVFLAPTPKHRIALGRKLAPTEPWGKWGEEIAASSVDNPSGMAKLTMLQNNPSERNGSFAIEILPAVEIDKTRAVKMTSNDHYVIKETPSESSATVAARIIFEEFEPNQKRVYGIYKHIRDLSEKVAVE